MSYAGQSTHGSTRLSVGTRAFADPVLAKASLDASNVLLSLSTAKPSRRLSVLRDHLERLGVSERSVLEEIRKATEAGTNPDQATFDAIRLSLANDRFTAGMSDLRHSIAGRGGWDSVVDGLGSMTANDKATGCVVAAGANTVGSAVALIPGYGTLIGGIIGIGSSIAGQGLDCGSEARQAQTDAAAAQARLASAQQNAMLAQAQVDSASRSKRIRTIVGGGAIMLAVLGASWLILD